jgi:hypothetical protein
MHYFVKLSGDVLVMGGRQVNETSIPMQETCSEGTAASSLSITQVLADGQLPGNVDDTGDLPVESAAKSTDPAPMLLILTQASVERHRIKRRHGHALRVHRVEAAERIAQYDQGFRHLL